MSHPNYGYGGPPQGPYQQQQPGYYPPQQPGGYPPQGPPQGPPQQYPGPGQHQYQQQPYPGAPQPHQNQQWSEHPPPQPYPRQGGGYPPQNQPLQGQYPPQGQYPLQQHSQYPPQQQGQYPPPGNYPPQTQGAYPPPQPMPIPPSLGYDPHQRAPGNATREAEALRKAMKGWGTDEKALINILTKPDPLQMALIRHTYTDHIGRNLEKDLKSELSGNLEDVLLALARGPLDQDVVYAHDAMSGLGTNEKALNDVLLGRSNADLRAIKYAYVAKYEKALVDDIKSDLSGKTEQFFVMLLNATRPEPGAYVDPQSVDADVREIHQATKARSGTDETGVSAVFLGASDAKLVAIAQAFETRYHTSLEALIKDEFSGHLREAFLSMLAKARDPVGHDADTILECLPVGGGADLKRLIYWVVHLHWNPPHFAAVKGRLRQKLGHDIGAQWRGAISSGDFHEAMRQLWNGV
ncbi:annexin [Aspergillus clavatus NRRL 1]|uniref:Annexin n=1 Tax=Aspergillus clavatus (strain ATCC 1007 / CBS 513.65 / DSM 816 / NCTC 3887 / NRRL 1 / QM 1276 / 107) TaxID=344612 RepID=A1C4F1_ASPCL|nr:annexin ANXC3.1 [Aspergillus clavatus NRRL 1]EAW15291.1 annexin ANXC3.1 [Aspergillus clavatus NRRL 1]